MQIYLITIDPTLGIEFDITLHPLGEFPWMAEAELRSYLATCPWEQVPISQCETQLAEGLWDYIKLNLQFIPISYWQSLADFDAFSREFREDNNDEGISDNMMRIAAIGQNPDLVRVAYTEADRRLDVDL